MVHRASFSRAAAVVTDVIFATSCFHDGNSFGDSEHGESVENICADLHFCDLSVEIVSHDTVAK